MDKVTRSGGPDISAVMVMVSTVQVILLTGVVVNVFSAVVIPDTVKRIHLDYVSTPAYWYQHDAACREDGGYLVLLEDPVTVQDISDLDTAIGGGLDDFFTRAVGHDDGQYYTHDDMCRPVNKSHWIWDGSTDTVSSAKRCTLVDVSQADKRVKEKECQKDHKAVCQFNQDRCPFQSTSVTLASLPVPEANMSVCQNTCRQMIGCFGTAPSGNATLPPFTHCLFIVTGDSSNIMTTIDCINYTKDQGPDPSLKPMPTTPSDEIPANCTPSSGASQESKTLRPLTDFLMNASDSGSYAPIPIPVSTLFVTTTLTEHTTTTATETVTTVDLMSTRVDHTMTVTVEASEPCSPRLAATPAVVTHTQLETVTHVHTSTFTSACQPQTTPSVFSTPTVSSISVRPKEEVMEELESMVKELTVNPEATSKQRRKKESAQDKRQSAQTIGTVAVVFLMLVGLLIVGMDFPVLYQPILRLKASVKESKKEKKDEEEG